jgi:hypothetical protein
MHEFDQLAKTNGATVNRIRGLTIVSLPLRLPVRLDIGFSTSYHLSGLGGFLPFLRHFEMQSGLYVYGERSEVFSRVAAGDCELCFAIRSVFDQYAFEITCSDMSLVARLNTIARPWSDDPSGGGRLLANLAVITRRLGELDYREFAATPRSRLMWGPSRSRKILTAAIVVFIFIMPFALPHVLHHRTSHSDQRRSTPPNTNSAFRQ